MIEAILGKVEDGLFNFLVVVGRNFDQLFLGSAEY